MEREAELDLQTLGVRRWRGFVTDRKKWKGTVQLPMEETNKRL
jgi:hypothetical protein